MLERAEGVIAPSRGSLRLFLLVAALLPLFIQTLYGRLPVHTYITDPSFKDFLFKILAYAAVGLIVPVRSLRLLWWVILFSHVITKDALFLGDASFYLTNIAGALLLFSILYRWMDAGLFILFCRAVGISLAANLGLQLLQHFQLDPFHSFHVIHPAGATHGWISIPQVPVGFMGNLVSLGIYYAAALPTLLVSCGALFPVVGAALLVGILLTHSKTALVLGAALYLACWASYCRQRPESYPRYRVFAFCSVAGFLALLPWSLSHASTLAHAVSHRWIIWKGAFRFLQSPWLGDGLSSWSLRRFWYSGSIWPQACNEYVQILYELGIIGLVLVLFYIARLILRVRQTGAAADDDTGRVAYLCILSTLISAFVFFPFHMPQTALILIVCLAYLERSIAHVGIA